MNPKDPKSSASSDRPIGPVRPPGAIPLRGRNGLLALSSLAVLAVYSAGYVRTHSAAQRFENEIAGRRPRLAPSTTAVVPAPPSPPAPEVSAPIAPPVATPPADPAPVPAVAASTPSEVQPWVASATVIPVVDPPLPVATPATKVEPAPAPPSAPAIAETTPASPDAPAPKWKDGKYSGWGSCRHGDIEATVVIRDGKIVSSVVSKCRTVYSCDVIAKVIPQVVERQSPDVDTVSGATDSADSYYWAVYSALAEAEIKPAAAK